MAIQKQLAALASTNENIVARLDTLEEGKPSTQSPTDEVTSDLGGGPVTHVGSPRNYAQEREKSLTLTFGDTGNCTARSLRLFIDHYELAASQKRDRGIEGWWDPTFRARELRLQLRGEPALWISHESAMT